MTSLFDEMLRDKHDAEEARLSKRPPVKRNREIAKVECVRGVLEGMGFSAAGVEAATSALELDGMVPIGRAMAVAGVGRSFVKAGVLKYGIKNVHRMGGGGNLVFLPGILDLAAKADVIRIGDGKVVNRKAVV